MKTELKFVMPSCCVLGCSNRTKNKNRKSTEDNIPLGKSKILLISLSFGDIFWTKVNSFYLVFLSLKSGNPLASKYGRNSQEVLNLQKFENTYEFENSHSTCESHIMHILSHNLHRRKALTFARIQSKLYKILWKDKYR